MIFAKEVNIPARPFMPIKNGSVDLPPQWGENIMEAVGDELKKAIKNA